jgi:riboflavin kinase/FMN adenylyltransferase
MIRKLIGEGNVVLANKLLGYHYAVEGRVIEGKKIGKQLGFPTANIKVIGENKMIPFTGAYAVIAETENREYRGMLNIGVRPTLADQVHNFTIEVHILDFDQDIYGKDIRLQFVERIRNEKKFRDAGELIEQLKKDRIETNLVFNKYSLC